MKHVVGNLIYATAPLLALIGLQWSFVCETEDSERDGWIERKITARRVVIRRMGAA